MVTALLTYYFLQTQNPVNFNANRAFEDLKAQVAFGVRYPGSEGHLKCRDWILKIAKENADNARLQEFEHDWSQGKKLKMWNVLAEQNWKDAKVRVLLIAHWDTRPYATEELSAAKAKQPILGANDGASGVAVLTELMRVMKDKLPKDVGVQYLFTDGEDVGPELDEMFLGAVHYAKNMPNPKPDYGILLDMIGDKDLRVPIEPNSNYFAPKLVEALYDHAKEIGLGSTFPKLFGPTISDDHIPLNEAGLRTIDLIDFDYPYWHTLEDTVDKCSAESLGKVGKLLETWLTKRPAFTYPK